MSPENVEVVRRSTEAYNRGDFDGMLEYWAPGAVLDWSNSYGLDARVFRGHNEIRVFMRRLLGSFEKARMELADDPEEIEDGLVIAENVAYLEGRDVRDLPPPPRESGPNSSARASSEKLHSP